MEKEDFENKIDAFSKRVIKSAYYDKTGKEFVPELMDRILQNEEAKRLTRVKPLISKRSWIFISICIQAATKSYCIKCLFYITKRSSFLQ